MLFMLHPDWPAPIHRRTVVVGRSKTIKMLVFERGKPVELTDGEAHQLAAIIGKALVPVTRDAKGRIRVRRLDAGDGVSADDHVHPNDGQPADA